MTNKLLTNFPKCEICGAKLTLQEYFNTEQICDQCYQKGDCEDTSP